MQLHSDADAAGVRLSAHDTLPSTNAEALGRARAGEAGPLWVTAARQTAGRGRRGKVWVSEPGNLYASLLLTDAAPAARLPELCFVVALAVRDATCAVAPSLASALKFKWPNDLLLAGAKVAGILIEAESIATRSAIVAGIGVNCEHHPQDAARTATNLSAHDAVTTPDQLFRMLSAAMVARLAQWDRGAGFSAIRTEWLAHAAGIGGDIRVQLADREITGTFETLDRIGRLMLRLPGGELEAITVGEVFAPSLLHPPLKGEGRREAPGRGHEELPPTRHASHVGLPLSGGGKRDL